MNINEQQKIRIGTCGWSVEDWRGEFYPRKLQSNLWLEYYARYFSAVEIDSTFHHVPSPQVVGRWLDLTPDHFCFTCKTPREITHDLKLRDCRGKMSAFLDSIAPLRSKLGSVLIQLPGAFHPAEDELALKKFVMDLPKDFRFAIEFQHGDWHLPRIFQLLEEHRVCWAWNDLSPLDQQNRAAFEFLPQTTDFLYVRLLGDLTTKYHTDGSRIHRYEKLMWPRDASMESWAIKIKKHMDESERVLAFANNHFEGFAPGTSQRIGKEFGFNIPLPAPNDEPKPEDPQLDLL